MNGSGYSLCCNLVLFCSLSYYLLIPFCRVMLSSWMPADVLCSIYTFNKRYFCRVTLKVRCFLWLPSGDYCQARLDLNEWPGNERLFAALPQMTAASLLRWMFYSMTVSIFLHFLFLLALFYWMLPEEELILTKASRENWFVKTVCNIFFFFKKWKNYIKPSESRMGLKGLESVLLPICMWD